MKPGGLINQVYMVPGAWVVTGFAGDEHLWYHYQGRALPAVNRYWEDDFGGRLSSQSRQEFEGFLPRTAKYLETGKS